MRNLKKFEITIFGQFKDSAMEKAFLNDKMKRNANSLVFMILVIGAIFMLFLIADYRDVRHVRSLSVISIVRASTWIMSLLMAGYIHRYKGKRYQHIATITTVFEAVSMGAFLIILSEYDTLSPYVLLSVLVIVLGVYMIPNKQINVQILTIVFLVVFFLFYLKDIEGLYAHDYQAIALYGFLIMLFGNINTYITNYYVRKQYIDSKELLRVSVTDSLTGIYNRAKFIQETQEWIEKCRIEKKDLSVILCDIDDFKKINDTYGHFAGDLVLQNVVSLINGCIRLDDIFARWGGEEFIVLLPDTDINKAYEIAQQMRTYIQDYPHQVKENETHNITCSFGLVFMKEDDKIESMMHRADLLLYKAKNAGKNVVICDKMK